MDEWEGIGPGMRIDRRSTDWGLVSLWIGGFFLVMAPVQLIFNDFYWSIGIHHATPDEIQQARVVAPLAGMSFLALIGFSVFAGFRGMYLARATGQAVALPLGGLLISGLDFLLWIGLTINICAILGMFL